MWIEALILSTLVASGIVLLAPNRYAGKLAAALSLAPLALSGIMWLNYDAAGNALLGGDMAYETTTRWVEFASYGLNWHVGVDGISMPLIVLTTILTTLAIVSAWTPIDTRQSQFYGLVLFLQAGLLGVFTALDFFVWFIFWEVVLVPMYFLIAIWGGPRRKYAAIKFFVYTNIASLIMFVGFLTLVFSMGPSVRAIDLTQVAQLVRTPGVVEGIAGFSPNSVKLFAFTLMFLGFAVKVPIVPFHTWLPDAHVEAPTPVSVLLAGVLLKMGTYALLRFNFTMLPGVVRDYAALIAVFAVVSVIYGALLALAQQDLKRIVAYSSISSMGYVILGLVAYTTHGVGGATFQMLSHGFISGLMFMVVGVIYNETHTRMVGDMSGMADRMPWTVGIFVAAAFGYMGLPLMSGFAGEVLVFLGSFDSTISPLFTAVAMFGIVIVAGYLLWAMQRTLFGPSDLETEYEITPAPVHDVAPLVVLLLCVIGLGVNPDIFYGMIQDAINPIIETQDALVTVLGGGLR
jgi:NADH-quinone oxidoreductase subunit M